MNPVKLASAGGARRWSVLALAVVICVCALTPAGAKKKDKDRDPAQNRLKVGMRVSVKGSYVPSGAFRAREVEVDEDQEDDDQELRGIIESIDHDRGEFKILGFTVEPDDDCEFVREPNAPAAFEDLQPGMRVRVDGELDDNGEFEAEKIRIRRDQDYQERRLIARIEAIELVAVGGVTLKLLGRDIIVDERSEIVIGGKTIQAAPVTRRVGSMDDDYLQFIGAGYFQNRVRLAGEVRLRGGYFSNPDLDDEVDDDELVPEVAGLLGVAANLGQIFVYAEVQAVKEFIVGSDRPFEDGESTLRFGEIYFSANQIFAPWFSVFVGRQKFDEDREWFYNTESLDAIRLMADTRRLHVELSLSQNVLDTNRNFRDQDLQNIMLQSTYRIAGKTDLQFYAIDRQDQTDAGDSPRLLGFRAIGSPSRNIEFWSDVAYQTGTRNRLDGITGENIIRDIDAWAWDVGFIYQLRTKLRPTFVVSMAHADGEGDGVRDLDPGEQAEIVDNTFRQSGLHRNRWKYGGVVSFRYYGEVLDPELSNIDILTLAVGGRPARNLSLDFLYNNYRQSEASRILRGELDERPNGIDPDIGEAFSLALGYEPSRRIELRLTAGTFRPGSAFDANASATGAARFQAKFRF